MSMNLNTIVRGASAALLLAWIQAAQAQSTVQPVYLRCEQQVNPLGVGNTTPRLSWQLESAGSGTAYRGETQSAYELMVGTAAGASDLWDSGKVASAQTVDVLYGGQPLTSGERCFWQVRVYDGHGNVSSWSAPGQWTMGLLATNNWTAQWIGYDAAYALTPQQAANNALFNTAGVSWIQYSGEQAGTGGIYQCSFLKSIVLPAGQAFTNAVMSLYADNSCGLCVNGQAATNLALRWEATAQINVTALLRAGTNVLALAATNSDAQPASVIGRLVVQFASGSISNFPVDTTWKAAQQPPAGWTATNFNDSAWSNAVSLGGTPWGTPSLNDIARVPAPYLRKDFTVGQTVTNATVYVTALGAYELHLNGQKVGNDVLTPGWTQFSKRVYYQTYDVTALVQTGSNTLSAVLGDGWYASVIGYLGHRTNYGGTPRLLAQLVLHLSNGTTQTVVSDSSWKASYGPIQYGDLLMGSSYDARQEIPGWDTTNFNDSAWSPVATGTTLGGYTNVTALVTTLITNNQLNIVANNTTFGGDPAYGIVKTFAITFQLGGGATQTLTFAENSTVSIGETGQTLTVLQALYGSWIAMPGPAGFQIQAAVTAPSQCFESLGATNLTQPVPGCYTFDLGQNMVGWVQLNISGRVGDRITVRHGEMLNPNGTIYAANLRGANATDFYIFGTNGTITYQPRFTFHGFRYVELRGLSVAPTLGSVTGIVAHSYLPSTGSFACSSPQLNGLYRNLIWGQKGNYFEVPTDCPQRDERLGWTGDTEFFVPTSVYNFDVQSFFHRHLVTLCEDAQEYNGSFANVAPDVGAGSGAAGWEDAAWICPYNLYLTYGDTNVITDHYAAFQTFGGFLASAASNYAIASLPGDFGDWVNLGGGATETVIDTAYYAYYAQAMAVMARAIGRTSDAASYAALGTNIAAEFATFFNTNGAFTDGSSQCGYALAFTLNLVPPALRTNVAQQFAASIAQFNDHLATGFIGTGRLLPALHEAGRDDLAYIILLQQTYPSWLYQVSLGATTMWERWDGWTPTGGFETPTMNSFNHYAFGAVGQYMYSVIGGINAASPGYQSVLIQPVTGFGLTWANTSFNSVHGPISTAWTNAGGVFNLGVAIPPNTTAQVWVPTTNASAITESGVLATNSPGVTYQGLSNGCAIYAVGSGQYFWSSPVAAYPPILSVTESNFVFSGGKYTNRVTPFPPLPGGDLLTNKSTTVVSNTLSPGPENHIPSAALYDGLIGEPGTTNESYEITGGAVTFYLGPGPNGTGYTVTNFSTYTAWQDDGREDANYTVSYSADGTNYYSVAAVGYNPSAYPTEDGSAGTLTELAVANLTGVRYLKWDFSAAQQNGGVGYTELAALGLPSPAQTPVVVGVPRVAGGNIVIPVSGLSIGQNCVLQSTTDLYSAVWITETNFVAAQAATVFTNSITNWPQKFYRVMQ
jgi:alpha-L-rhamnosidase